MKPIIPVILAGGSGTRLWPLSRKKMPKQFARLSGENSLFQNTLARVSDRKIFAAPMIVGSEGHHSIIATQLKEAGIDDATIVLEPVGRDTAAAIALAVEASCQSSELMLALPSDHAVTKSDVLVKAITDASEIAGINGRILTFGIKPKHAETAYGYLKCGMHIGNKGARHLDHFIEKPNATEAALLVQNEMVLWNAGMFLFHRDILAAEFEQHAQDVISGVRRALIKGTRSYGVVRPDSEAFAKVRAISLDYAIMEKTKLSAVMPVDPGWTDLGTWNSVWEISELDEQGNHFSANVYGDNNRNCLAISDGPAIGIAGLENIVVVANRDAILVASRDNPQAVKQIVQKMSQDEHPAIVSHPFERRPWGQFVSIDRGAMHQVKRISVNPGGQLSLQYHHHRCENWIVVSGVATVTVDDKVSNLTPSQQVFIPQGAVHRLENFGDVPVEIIEVQYGQYLGEDDIVRLDDIYGRTATDVSDLKIAS